MVRNRQPRRPGRRLLDYDRRLGVRMLAGADEVGRGSLAGPLVAASVVFDYRMLVGPFAAPLGHLDDSKKLTPAMRDKLYDVVLAAATAWSVVIISPSTIDRVGLHRSNINALSTALERFRCVADLALVDGFKLPNPPLECRHVIKGDATSAAIAAASILAKVTRDRLMCRLDRELDGRWAFADHMGYATPLHHERIQKHGVCHLHRRSFDSIAYTDSMWADLAALERPSERVAVVLDPLERPSERVADVLDPLDPGMPVAVHEEYVEPVALHPAL